MPDNLVMAQFMSIRLRALALAMNHPIVMSDWWGPIALQALEQAGLPYESWRDMAQLKRHCGGPEVSIQVNRFG